MQNIHTHACKRWRAHMKVTGKRKKTSHIWKKEVRKIDDAKTELSRLSPSMLILENG